MSPVSTCTRGFSAVTTEDQSDKVAPSKRVEPSLADTAAPRKRGSAATSAVEDEDGDEEPDDRR